jgi:hypothetical protein
LITELEITRGGGDGDGGGGGGAAARGDDGLGAGSGIGNFGILGLQGALGSEVESGISESWVCKERWGPEEESGISESWVCKELGYGVFVFF